MLLSKLQVSHCLVDIRVCTSWTYTVHAYAFFSKGCLSLKRKSIRGAGNWTNLASLHDILRGTLSRRPTVVLNKQQYLPRKVKLKHSQPTFIPRLFKLWKINLWAVCTVTSLSEWYFAMNYESRTYRSDTS